MEKRTPSEDSLRYLSQGEEIPGELLKKAQERDKLFRQRVIDEYSHVHDNIILSYQVDIGNKELKIITEYPDKEEVTITFTGLATHRFEYVTYHNIIACIWQVSTDFFVEENRDLLEKYLRYGAPIVAENCDKLKEYLSNNGLKVFEIGASMGLSGFVMAKEISIEVVELTESP